MTFVATLLAGPSYALTASEGKAAKALLAATDCHWLAPGKALDLYFEPGETAETLTAQLREEFTDRPVDVAVQPLAHRRKKLLIADMDSTMIGQECIDELAAEIGVKDKVAAITERAMRGELDFEASLTERVALLAGLETAAVQRVLATRIQLTPGGTTLVQTMKAHGGFTALVSGGFTAFVAHVAAEIGFDRFHANELVVDGDVFSGHVREPILGPDAKRERLKAFIRETGCLREDSLAVGDGANDLAMIDHAGLGVAFHAKPAVAARADVSIQHSDLSALLFLQGYRSADFIG